jgi:hypothetical protein
MLQTSVSSSTATRMVDSMMLIAKACVIICPVSLINAMLLASTPNHFQYHHGSSDGKREEEFPLLDCALLKELFGEGIPRASGRASRAPPGGDVSRRWSGYKVTIHLGSRYWRLIRVAGSAVPRRTRAIPRGCQARAG